MSSRCRIHRRRCVAGKGGCFSRRLEAQGRMQPPLEGKSTLPIINSFLNLCRVCPVPTDDKVNSEYKRNFTWHDGYQTTKVEVVRNAPSIPSCAEPSLPRKKKYPCAPARDYLLYNGENDAAPDAIDADSRARSEERKHFKGRASPRSRSADSTISGRLKATVIPDEDTRSVTKATYDVERKRTEEKQMSGGDVPPRTEEGYVPKTTEYRSQFVAYPRTPDACPARKSASMGLIGKKDVVDGEVPSADSWNVMPSEDVDDAALDAVKRGRIKKTEYKAKFRPFSAYTYVDGNWKKATRLIKDSEDHPNAWYSEVVERLKKADQYKTRSYTGNEATEILSPVAASSRTWKDDRPAKERGRSAVPVHHKKEADHADSFKHRDGSMKKKPQVEKTTARPKSAEPVIPVSTKPEHRSPKRSRPRAPRDLPLKGHGDLSGRKKKHGSPSGKSKGKVWLKSDVTDGASKQLEEQGTLLNGFASEEEAGKMVNGEVLDDSVLEEAKLREEYPRGPVKVPLTSVKSPEEMTGVRSPDPESWTVPLDIGKGLHWMDGKTPDGIQAKGPPILLSKRFKESSLIGKSQKDLVLCDPGIEVSGEGVDL